MIEQRAEYLKLLRDTFDTPDDGRYRGFLLVMKMYKQGKYVRLFSFIFSISPISGFVFFPMLQYLYGMDLFG